VSNHTSKSIVVFYEGLKFGFTRDHNDQGFWYCLSPKPGIFGFGPHCVVPKQYWGKIRMAAISQGYNADSIVYSPPENVVESEGIKIYAGEKKVKSTKSDAGIKIF